MPDVVIGRKEELKTLETAFESKKAELMVVYMQIRSRNRNTLLKSKGALLKMNRAKSLRRASKFVSLKNSFKKTQVLD